MSDAEKRLREWLTKYQQRGTLTDEARGHLDALMAEHGVALSRARAEALEAAAKEADAHGVHVTAHNIRRLITTPAPATIPVERVRAVLINMNEEAEAERGRDAAAVVDAVTDTLSEMARRLGVDLDAKGEKAPQVCECGHDEGWHHYGKKRGCMKKMDDRTTCVCKTWHPAEASAPDIVRQAQGSYPLPVSRRFVNLRCRHCSSVLFIVNDVGDERCSGCGRDWAPVSP